MTIPVWWASRNRIRRTLRSGFLRQRDGGYYVAVQEALSFIDDLASLKHNLKDGDDPAHDDTR